MLRIPSQTGRRRPASALPRLWNNCLVSSKGPWVPARCWTLPVSSWRRAAAARWARGMRLRARSAGWCSRCRLARVPRHGPKFWRPWKETPGPAVGKQLLRTMSSISCASLSRKGQAPRWCTKHLAPGVGHAGDDACLTGSSCAKRYAAESIRKGFVSNLKMAMKKNGK